MFCFTLLSEDSDESIRPVIFRYDIERVLQNDRNGTYFVGQYCVDGSQAYLMNRLILCYGTRTCLTKPYGRSPFILQVMMDFKRSNGC